MSELNCWDFLVVKDPPANTGTRLDPWSQEDLNRLLEQLSHAIN